MTRTIAEFMRDHKITMSAAWAARNPWMDDPKGDMHHYRCIFRHGRKRMSTYFSMGPALTQEPSAEDVLDCLASDSSSVENARDFADWCEEYTYSPDNRRAKRTWDVCKRQAAKLKDFLGEENYRSLLWETERL